MEKTLRVAVAFGGTSSEHRISGLSAHNVLSVMAESNMEQIVIGITQNGQWLHYTGDIDGLLDGSWETHDVVPVVLVPGDKGGLFEQTPKGLQKIDVDVVFPVMHGQGGEDGTIQGALEICKLPYVGCGVLSSALCMDKEAAHNAVEAAGIRVPKSACVYRGYTQKDIDQALAACGGSYPLFVKPACGGSSIGVHKVTNYDELTDAVAQVAPLDEKIDIEEGIVGREVACSIIGREGGELAMGDIDEIVLTDDGFFHIHQDQAGEKTSNSSVRIPAQLTDEAEKKVREAGLAIYRACSCSGLARVDVFVTDEDEVVFNEVNTLPGLTHYSRFPGMMMHAGYDMREVFEKLIYDAYEQGPRS